MDLLFAVCPLLICLHHVSTLSCFFLRGHRVCVNRLRPAPSGAVLIQDQLVILFDMVCCATRQLQVTSDLLSLTISVGDLLSPTKVTSAFS